MSREWPRSCTLFSRDGYGHSQGNCTWWESIPLRKETHPKSQWPITTNIYFSSRMAIAVVHHGHSRTWIDEDSTPCQLPQLLQWEEERARKLNRQLKCIYHFSDLLVKANHKTPSNFKKLS